MRRCRLLGRLLVPWGTTALVLGCGRIGFEDVARTHGAADAAGTAGVAAGGASGEGAGGAGAGGTGGGGGGTGGAGASGAGAGGVAASGAGAGGVAAGGVAAGGTGTGSTGGGGEGTGGAGAGGVSTGGQHAGASGAAGTPSGTAGGGAGGGGALCVPTSGAQELCDGRDNDCDGQTDGPTVCTDSCEGVARGDRGYMLCPGPSVWQGAANACVAAGMHLVRVDDSAENSFLRDLAAERSVPRTWLGGSDRNAEGTWEWTDGSAFWTGGAAGSAVSGAFASFGSGEPSSGTPPLEEDCLELLEGGSWNDTLCLLPLPFVCETSD